jgi:hypothetical protein
MMALPTGNNCRRRMILNKKKAIPKNRGFDRFHDRKRSTMNAMAGKMHNQ